MADFAYAELAWKIPPRVAYFVSKLVDAKGYDEYGPYQSKWLLRHYVDEDSFLLVVRTPTLSSKAINSLAKHVEELLNEAKRQKETADRVREKFIDSLRADGFVDSVLKGAVDYLLEGMEDVEEDPLADIPSVWEEESEVEVIE